MINNRQNTQIEIIVNSHIFLSKCNSLKKSLLSAMLQCAVTFVLQFEVKFLKQHIFLDPLKSRSNFIQERSTGI